VEEFLVKHILVVEDESVIRSAIMMVLEMGEFKVTGAADGQEALNTLRGDDLPDAILLDLMMPVMDGWQFRQAQLADARIAAIPVIVLSACNSVHEQAAALSVAGYLQKPVPFQELLTAVKRHVG
jgi:CheY-like chemotaxis protein